MLVQDFLVIELKAQQHITAIAHAQILTYMKLAEAPVGLIINFNSHLLKNGIKRFAP